MVSAIVDRCGAALEAADRLFEASLAALRRTLASSSLDPAHALIRCQSRAHGCAWVATYVRTLREMREWASRLDAEGRCGELETLLLQAVFSEYLAQLAGGLPMSQGEIFRLNSLGLHRELDIFRADPAVCALSESGFAPGVRSRIALLVMDDLPSRRFGDPGFEDSTLEEIRRQFSQYADDYAEAAHQWHLRDELIPDAVIEELGALGVFGLTIPEQYGGSGMDKTAMCVVTEELSRGHIGLGSLGTRAEIAAELIRLNGTDQQKADLLPRIASGAIISTAVFTEPDTGSDLGSLSTRAERTADGYRIYGNKTWITHGARSDLMTLLARTGHVNSGYRGLSMFLAVKPRGNDADPFPARGMRGSEIPVLGYRGMKEYEIAFDGFEVPSSSLLGGEEGRGFKQLMETFESARIQTAARAIGVAQCAFELGLSYASERIQFGRPIVQFPRVADKLAWMAAETMAARQLTLFAAREKDGARRCSLEAGMAKLLAARVAWANADNAVQIHGGNGYALEYRVSRILCDARILSVFEGAAEIQAQVIVKQLLAEGG
jgi:(2S)-methylsuccinyl-CoA dehydrogenase